MMYRLMSQSALDNTAFAGRYQKYWLTVLNYIRQRISSREDAEDILLEVFLAALEDEEPFLSLGEKQQLAWLRRSDTVSLIRTHSLTRTLFEGRENRSARWRGMKP